MSTDIHLRDGVVINLTDANVDVVHSATDPLIILIKVGTQTYLWISADNFDYARSI